MITIDKIVILTGLIFMAVNLPQGEEKLRIGHEYRPESELKERIPARFYSSRTDTVVITFYCKPDNGRTEYHVVPVKNDTAETVSAIYCPEVVVAKAVSNYGTYYDSLDVAVIRKTIPDLQRKGNSSDHSAPINN